MSKCRDGRDITYRDIYDLFLMLRVIPMLLPHPPGCGSLLSRSTICGWQAIGVRKYDPGGPARVRNLLIYLAGWAPCTYDLHGSVFSLYVPGSGLFKAGTSPDEEKEG